MWRYSSVVSHTDKSQISLDSRIISAIALSSCHSQFTVSRIVVRINFANLDRLVDDSPLLDMHLITRPLWIPCRHRGRTKRVPERPRELRIKIKKPKRKGTRNLVSANQIGGNLICIHDVRTYRLLYYSRTYHTIAIIVCLEY